MTIVLLHTLFKQVDTPRQLLWRWTVSWSVVYNAHDYDFFPQSMCGYIGAVTRSIGAVFGRLEAPLGRSIGAVFGRLKPR